MRKRRRSDKPTDLKLRELQKALHSDRNQKTFLKPNQTFYIPNYDIHRTDRQDRPGGGTAILIKKSIPHIRLNQTKMTTLEHTAIRLELPHFPLHIYSIYKAPNSPLNTDDLLQITCKPSLIAGDFNCKHPWWSRVSNHNGLKLYRFLENNPDYYVHYPDTQTRFDTNSGQGDVLDIAITYNIQQPLLPITLSDLNSDHLPIIFTLNTHYDPIPPKTPQNENQYEWEKFASHIQNNITNANPSLHNKSQIDSQILELTSTIQSALKTALKRQPFLAPDKTYSPLPSDIVKLIKCKNRLRKWLHRTGDLTIKRDINHLKNKIKYEIKKTKY